jgi:cytochrome d ubiquinol oxidase subunit I
MAKFGSVFGLSFTLEGVAFFLEGIFVGIYLYGWDRLSPKAHWLAGLPIAISGVASAWFVVTVNSWMNAPQGFRLEEGVVVEVFPLQAMLNPATGAQTTHMIVAAYMVTGFMVATVHAVALLRGGARRHHGRAMALGLALAAPLAPLQLVVGDWAARVVAAIQPVKLAAMEGQFRTQRRAPLRIGGVPDAERHVTRYAIEVPGALSWLAYGDVNAEVRGLDAFPSGDLPPTAIVHVAFQLMVLAGTLLLTAAASLGWMRWRRGQWPSSRAALLGISFCGPLAVIALESGWVVTEVGRQPWIVHGLLRTADAVTAAPGVRSVFAVTLAIYAMLLIGTVVAFRLLARAPLPEAAHGD